MTDQHRELRLAARDLLRGSGPLTAGELADRLRDEGHEPGDPVLLRARLFEVNDDRGEPTVFTAFPVPGGRLADIDHLLDGLVLTHELRPDERRAGAADVDDDLAVVPLASLDGRTVPLADGGTLDIVVSEDFEARLTGPEGWLPEAPLLVVTFADGRLAITGARDRPDADPDVASALRDAWQWLVDEGEDHDVASLVVVARMQHPELLSSPAAPLEELLDAVDLWVDDDGGVWDVEDDGLDDGFDDALDDGLTAHLLDDHGLTEEQVGDLLRIDIVVQEASNRALREIHSRLEQAIADDEHREEALEKLTTTLGREHARAMMHDQVDAEVTAALAAVLGDLDATEAFLHDLVGDDPLHATMTLTLLDGTPLDLSRRDRANQHWLRARLLEFVTDDHTEAERELVRARGLDDAHPELLYDLAGYKEDRGDAGAALGLLRQVTGVDPDRLAMLEHFARPGPTSAGRNDPCPCGSGRKHKVCCAPRNGWPLARRADWVREKLVRHHGRPSTTQVLDGGLVLADLALGDDGADDDLALVVLCVSLFEGGVAAHFADVRGALLPADELALVRSLAEARAGAFEVTDVGSDGRVELVDLRTGDHLDVEDRAMPAAVSVGQRLFGWVATTADGPEAQYGMVAVPEEASTSLLEVLDDEPGVADLLAWFAGHPATS